MDKKRKNIIIILATVILLLFLALLLFFLNRPRVNDTSIVGNTSSNLYNGGTFCQRGNKVFFANSNDNDALYVMNIDETNPKKIVSNAVLSINADDEWVYYSLSGKTNGQGLGYVRKSAGLYGTNYRGTKSLCYTQNPVATATLLGNTLYYQNYVKSSGTSLYGISINKDNNHQIFEEMVNPSCVNNGYIYFSGIASDHYLYAFDPVTEAYSSIYDKDVYMPVYHTDGWIYYLDPSEKYTLHRYSPSNGEDTRLFSDRIDFFNVFENVIYYQVSSGDNPALHKAYTDGSSNIVLAEGVYKNLQTTTTSLYFRDYDNDSITYHVMHNSGQISVFDPK